MEEICKNISAKQKWLHLIIVKIETFLTCCFEFEFALNIFLTVLLDILQTC